LNRLYRHNPALYQVDFHYAGFEWVDFRDVEHSVICFLRRAEDPSDYLLFCCNFTPVPRVNYEVGVPHNGVYREIFNSDSVLFGGSNVGNGGAVSAEHLPSHGRPASMRVTLPPLGVVVFKP
jgi:1,4-alpha-glucan branching enzyme